jgi:5'-nucleotidase
LVTNDDGIESEGLHVLAQQLTKLGDVTVFAPSGEYSGAGASIGHLGPGLPDVFKVDRVELPDVAAVYHLDGPPALASLLACKGLFGDVPDIVVSGINPGWNVGHAVHFSGTVGACITADIFDVPAIAVSQHIEGQAMQWSTAAQAAADQVESVVAQPRLLNINVPNIAWAEVKGVKHTVLADRIPYSLHSPTITEVSNEPGRFGADFERHGPFHGPDGSDTFAVEAGFISLTELTSTHAAVRSAKVSP